MILKNSLRTFTNLTYLDPIYKYQYKISINTNLVINSASSISDNKFSLVLKGDISYEKSKKSCEKYVESKTDNLLYAFIEYY